jgi:hypothetical protein
MSLFEPPPNPPEPPPEPARAPWMRPEAVLGSVAPVNFVLARTETVAGALWGITVFGSGFEFTVASITPKRLPHRLRMHPFELIYDVRSGGDVPADLVRRRQHRHEPSARLRLRWTRAARRATEPKAASRVLLPGGGGGSDRYWTQQYWCWPLPPPGPLTFVCEWPASGST